MKNLHLKHLRYNCASKAKVSEQGGSVHSTTEQEILFFGVQKTALSSPQRFPVRAVVLSKKIQVSCTPSPILKGGGVPGLEVDNFARNQSITRSGPRGQLPGMEPMNQFQDFFAKNTCFLLFFRWVFVVWLQRDVVLVMINRYMIIVIVSIFFCGTYMYSV